MILSRPGDDAVENTATDLYDSKPAGDYAVENTATDLFDPEPAAR